MKILLTTIMLVAVLSGCKTLERIVYVDQYVPVVVLPVLPECKKPTSNVDMLSEELRNDDGAYLQAHAADDVAIRGYADCNAKVISESNQTSSSFNKGQLLSIPVEKRSDFIEKLPESIKKAISE